MKHSRQTTLSIPPTGSAGSPGGPAPAPLPAGTSLRSSASPKTGRYPEPGAPPGQGGSRMSVPLLPPPPPPPLLGVERPYFDDVSPRNVTAIVGQSAILNCRVKHLGDRTE
ncbi:hypothetical protein J437_LFUL013743 [Ladona fulva]|uniref:Uncharacterized protein n=1 Tax=Ladona fulva TaxID=123851 RepID=A0A8K0KC32_LADFU|nr:hypothetical protein J437_LFUL013743 [Ladona fulva]